MIEPESAHRLLYARLDPIADTDLGATKASSCTAPGMMPSDQAADIARSLTLDTERVSSLQPLGVLLAAQDCADTEQNMATAFLLQSDHKRADKST
ncbi:hypothetical protein RRG08_024786 [Elysia crispata]|uniref:Uncharacterized protein n=1 Tax=Elysia crispata TaxID=231223 RepID=A0AAE0XQH6_9GAST|nr:hypothetical protein RRG08_024786 [Elysia crispata]